MKPLPYRTARELPTERIRAALNGQVELGVLFGSLATGKTHAESDIDIAVWPHDGTDLNRLAGELMAAVGSDRVDVADLRRASGTLSQIVATRGRVLYEATPGRFAEFAALAERRWQDELHRLPDRLRALDVWLEARHVQ